MSVRGWRDELGRGSYEAGLHVRALRRRFVDGRAIEEYLRTHAVRRLQLGAGPNVLPGWLNTDLVPDAYPELRSRIVLLDAAKPFPLPTASLDIVFSEHQIEHISERSGRTMLAECFRVLRPGGRIRIATPDLASMVALYAGELDKGQQHYVDWVMSRFLTDVRSGNPRCYVINQMFTAYGHRFIYDEETLTAALADVGFVDVVRFSPGESAHPELRGIEGHGRAIGNEDANRFETLVLEAGRP